MAKDRSRDDRRSVGSFDKMRVALGKAAGWKTHPGHSVAFKNDNSEYFAPGHGHVKTGLRGVYNPDTISQAESTSFGATKGLNG
jgi:hypothetical protein